MRRLASLVCLAGLSCDDPTPRADVAEPWPAHVSAVYPGPCLQEEWIGEPGEWVRLIVTMRWGHDALGRQTLFEQVSDIIAREETSFDDKGRPFVSDEFHGLVGEYTNPLGWSRLQRIFDDDDRVVQVLSDRALDGTINSQTTIRRNERGDELLRRSTTDHPHGRDVRSQTTYDAQGNPVRRVYEEWWPAAPGRPARYVHTVSETDWMNGHAVEHRHDRDGDGIFDQTQRYAYDDSGRRLLEWADEDGDGQPEQQIVLQYALDGRRVETAWDDDGDGRFDRRVIETTSADGAMVERVFDSDADGDIDDTTVIETTATGRTTLHDAGADGSIDSRHVVEWLPGDPQSVVRDARDDNADGQPEHEWITTYGPHGWTERREFEAGVLVNRVVATYDRHGNQLSSLGTYRGFRFYYVCPWSRFERQMSKPPRSTAAPPALTAAQLVPVE